ncbi:MAG: leucine-rich repeat domain-containing protein [Spirochaetaceae bacterium]|nr:leucine-rich repeat domain-containing protein [Spirochaetaceae bacterium]
MNKQIVSIEAVVEMVMELKSGEYTLQIQENGGMEGAVTGREILKYLKGTKSNVDYDNLICSVVGTNEVRRLKDLYKKEPRKGKFHGGKNNASESSRFQELLHNRAKEKILEYIKENLEKTEYQIILEGVNEQRVIKQLGVLGDVLRKRSNLHLHLDLSLLSVSRLEKGLFHNCVALQSVVLPNNCWVVGSRCFASCKNLTQVTLSQELVSLGMFSFDSCQKLEKIIFPKKLKVIGKYCFRDCTSLSAVELPPLVQNLHNHCFAGCTKLTHIHLPKNLEFVAGTSFLGCTHLTFSLDKMNTSFSTDSSGKLLLSYDGKILHAYPSATGQVKLPSGIQRIGSNLFRHCKDITDIELPEGLEVIDEFAFMDCRALRSLQLPKSLQKLGWSAFVACTGLQEVILLGKLENLSFGHCEDEEVLERSCQYPSLKQTNGWNDVIGDGVNPKIRVLTEDFSV